MEVDMPGKWFARLRNYASLVAAYTRLNLNAQLEYRAAFISQVIAMFINDGVWVAFWALFFTRFPVIKGWTIYDVITIWAITAAGFGLAHAVFGTPWNWPDSSHRGSSTYGCYTRVRSCLIFCWAA
jgi:ABC-type uncharacterized transport system permease subunit